ncbi:hypothetical protein K439DRAFT_1645149 [Ramaria rubella]|nr:hypothetical protein K439DRAFT_1645149 [Ramaria rubella]
MRAEVLELPHWHGTQADRLRPALEARNERMMGIGQEQWNHACDKCTHVFDGADGQKRAIRSVVTDGIALSHPCCTGELECKNLLPNSHAIYCMEHQYRVGQCAVTTCSNPVTPGCKTCADLQHRACEDYYKLMGKAMFQLKLWLERNKVGQPHASVPEDGESQGPDIKMVVGDACTDVTFHENKGAGLDNEELLVTGTGEVESVLLGGLLGSAVAGEGSPSCPSKPPTGNRTDRAWFGRKRTHNEELCMGSCGMILGWVTFYGSEGPNCVHGDTYFQNCALPVNVFHYKCKHKKTNTWCTQNCNPTHWPELMRDGSGVFNLSAAEQTNAWFGGLLSIICEMHVDRYNFSSWKR